jgi:hypothetical protein
MWTTWLSGLTTVMAGLDPAIQGRIAVSSTALDHRVTPRRTGASRRDAAAR